MEPTDAEGYRCEEAVAVCSKILSERICQTLIKDFAINMMNGTLSERPLTS